MPDGVTVTVEKNTAILISGVRKRMSDSSRRNPRAQKTGAVQRQRHPLRRRGHPQEGRQESRERRRHNSTITIMNARKKLNKNGCAARARSSARIFGTAERPRLAVHRTNRFIYAELIDDTKAIRSRRHRTSARKGEKAKRKRKSRRRKTVGEAIGKKAVSLGIKEAVFDRRSYRFHGRVKSLAEGAKKAGLKI